MPTMANITVKKADGTTDVVYTAIQPAGGDGLEALWRVEAIGSIAGNRPVFSLKSKSTQDKRARVVDFSLIYPEIVTNASTGVASVRTRATFRGSIIVSLDAADVTNQECAAQAANLLKSVLIQSCLTAGFAPV